LDRLTKADIIVEWKRERNMTNKQPSSLHQA
jgi:hypothetical protein